MSLKNIKSLPAGIIFALCLGATPAAPAKAVAAKGSAAPDPIAIYGDTITFDVLRDGSPVGRQVVSFARQGDRLRVTIQFDIAIRFLFFTAYRYSYDSVANWRGGQLHSLVAHTNGDGKKTRIEARRIGDRIRIQGPAGVVWGTADLLPSNHWNSEVLKADRVFNTLNGRINRVKIVDLGATEILAEGRKKQARHFRYTGDLDVESWYDMEGRWLKLRFKGTDGSTIEYVCRRCAAPKPGATAK